MDEYDLCNQPKREARREVVKKDLCEKGYKKRTQQNEILGGVRRVLQSGGSRTIGAGHGAPHPKPCAYFRNPYLVNFLKTLMPRVTTRIAPTTGIATGTIAEIALIMSLAVVDSAPVRDSVTVAIAVGSMCVSFPINSLPSGQRLI